MTTPTNYYADLCTEMYEILHPTAPQDELAFYLSYAREGDRMLEPLCRSGRFLVPFLERGFNAAGMDSSAEMLAKLRVKAPEAEVECADLLTWTPKRTYDYVFITSGSMSLFTDPEACRRILEKTKAALAPEGVFVFEVDTVATSLPDDADWRTSVEVKTPEGFDLVLKSKNRWEGDTRIQYSPSIYELRREGEILKREPMDFQIRLYAPGEMEALLHEVGFGTVRTYGSYAKTPATGIEEMFLFECRV